MAEVATLPALITDQWDWQVEGACRGLSADLFFNPDFERGKAKRMREAGAKAVCATCPVMAQCLDWAMTVAEPYGIWGGTTPEERRDLRNDRAMLALVASRGVV